MSIGTCTIVPLPNNYTQWVYKVKFADGSTGNAYSVLTWGEAYPGTVDDGVKLRAQSILRHWKFVAGKGWQREAKACWAGIAGIKYIAAGRRYGKRFVSGKGWQ